MPLQHIAVAGVAPQPWRNGGGSTRELFTWPAGGGATWQLRISMADIAADGPFSAYPGVDRWFAVLHGAGVRLALPGTPAQTLTTTSAPLAFAGEGPPACTLVDGPTSDMNLMLQRGSGTAGMWAAQPGVAWQHSAALRALFTTAPMHLRVDNAAPQPVAGWTLLLGRAAGHQRWVIDTPIDTPIDAPIDALPVTGRAIWLAFTPQPPVKPQ